MKRSEAEETHNDILGNLSHYALIKNNEGLPYTIYDINSQSFVYVNKFYDELISIMLERGVKVVNDINEVRNPNRKHTHMKLDPETGEWREVPMD
jgi:hypothetical protein